jgi:hypothetical protein
MTRADTQVGPYHSGTVSTRADTRVDPYHSGTVSTRADTRVGPYHLEHGPAAVTRNRYP